jgi:hypothetical protein
LRPLVSPSSAIFQLCAWISQNICMWTLAALCERTFSWGGAMEITTILFEMVSAFGNYWRFDTFKLLISSTDFFTVCLVWRW